MTRVSATVVLVLALASAAWAQQGVAEAGYWPTQYHGSTFTGKVTAVGDRFTLRYGKDKKAEEMSFVFDSACQVPTVDGKMGAMTPADVPMDSVVTAYYYVAEKKVNGQTVKENVAIAIKFQELNGKPVKNKKLFPCVAPATRTEMKAFNNPQEQPPPF